MGLEPPVVANLGQAYASWNVTDYLRLDIGVFTSFIGAENLHSWENLNYTRGALYFLFQPGWHTGLRATYEQTFGDHGVEAELILVNGSDRLIEADDIQPHVGAELSYAFREDFDFMLAYYTGRSGSGYAYAADPDSWEHVFDLMAELTLGNLWVLLDLNLYGTGGSGSPAPDWGGGLSLGVGYTFAPMFRAALRGEYARDGTHGFGDGWDHLVTATGTLDLRPQENLVIRLEGRLEWADDDTFYIDDATSADLWGTLILGVVVTTAP